MRDATGNILSVYTYNDTSVNKGQLSQIETNLYGSNRLGMNTLAINVQDLTTPAGTSMTGLGMGRNVTFIRGKKFFELTNHLGNVLATVSDRKRGVSLNNTTVDHYNAVIVNAQEYYPFGMLMPGRGGQIGTGKNIAGIIIKNGDTIPAILTVTQRTNNLPATYMATEAISFEDGFSSGDSDAFTTLMVDQSNADAGSDNGVSYGIAGKGYRYGFNGQERSDDIKGEGNSYTAQFWEYDPSTGRRWNLDPKPIEGISSYLVLGNNPISNIDPDGDLFFGLFGSTSEQRQAAKVFVKENGGEVRDRLSRNIHVNYDRQQLFSDESGNIGFEVINSNQHFKSNGLPETGSILLDNWNERRLEAFKLGRNLSIDEKGNEQQVIFYDGIKQDYTIESFLIPVPKGLNLLYHGTIGGVMKSELGKKVMGDAAKKLNTFTARAVEAGFTGTASKRVKAGFFVQLNHNIPRLLSGKNWSILYNSGKAAIVARTWQNQAIGLGLSNIVGGGALGTLNFNKSINSPLSPYDPNLMYKNQ
ncbi:RHS repeat-associated core domain-containing protein [Chitinophaga silvisoli]|nr:hypothetical protein [Chitinophaga silvisoli]